MSVLLVSLLLFEYMKFVHILCNSLSDRQRDRYVHYKLGILGRVYLHQIWIVQLLLVHKLLLLQVRLMLPVVIR